MTHIQEVSMTYCGIYCVTTTERQTEEDNERVSAYMTALQNPKVSTWCTGSVCVCAGKKNWVFSRSGARYHDYITQKEKQKIMVNFTFPKCYASISPWSSFILRLYLLCRWSGLGRKTRQCRCNCTQKHCIPNAVRSAKPHLEVIIACVQISPAVNNICTVWPRS